MAEPLLSIRDLRVEFPGIHHTVRALDGLSLDLARGRVLGVVGESGCGKSVTARAALQILDHPGRISGGRILLDPGTPVETDIASLPAKGARMRDIRGGRIGLIFQEPMTALSSHYTVGNQIVEAVRIHADLSKAAAREKAVSLLRDVGIPRPETRIDAYPFQLSGGLRQRVGIALALAGDPDILIADEPTTALDVTTQAQILDLLRRLQREKQVALMLITHDMGVIAEMADEVAVMYLGRVAEVAPVAELFAAPLHPYTRALLRSVPSILAEPRQRLATIGGAVPQPAARPAGPGAGRRLGGELLPGVGGGGVNVLEVEGLQKHYPIHAGLLRRETGRVRAVDGISFSIARGETLALVGESGCGKTTASRCIVRALQPTAGSIRFTPEPGRSIDLARLSRRELRPVRRLVQMIFQDPYASLNPRMVVGSIIAEPLLIAGVKAAERRRRVLELLDLVGLPAAAMTRFPHAFSGGQRQRIGIARALALHPRLVVADEPVSALDVSVQAQIVNLLLDLQDRLGLSMLFVAHDLSVVRHISNRVAVMYLGRIVELAPTASLYTAPRHPYTEALLAAVPKADPALRGKRVIPAGEMADPAHPPPGCVFHPRCPYAEARCRVEVPGLDEVAPGRWSACLRAGELELAGVGV